MIVRRRARSTPARIKPFATARSISALVDWGTMAAAADILVDAVMEAVSIRHLSTPLSDVIYYTLTGPVLSTVLPMPAGSFITLSRDCSAEATALFCSFVRHESSCTL